MSEQTKLFVAPAPYYLRTKAGLEIKTDDAPSSAFSSSAHPMFFLKNVIMRDPRGLQQAFLEVYIPCSDVVFLGKYDMQREWRDEDFWAVR